MVYLVLPLLIYIYIWYMYKYAVGLSTSTSHHNLNGDHKLMTLSPRLSPLLSRRPYRGVDLFYDFTPSRYNGGGSHSNVNG